jgi:hypothetical protein
MVSGKIDAVEETHGQLVPLEYKKGRMGQHLSDHFQLCAAALCLEERTGKEIPYGEIFYHANRRRERVYFLPTCDRPQRMRSQRLKLPSIIPSLPRLIIAKSAELAAYKKSACPQRSGCSVPKCFQLTYSLNPMSSLYITQPDAVLSKQYEAFKVALKQEDGTWQKQSIPAQTIEQVILMGNPQVTGDALMYALELGMPVHYLSSFGKYLGAALPGHSRNGQLRLAQYGLYQDTEQRLALVKAMITAKIHNQYAVLYRHGQKENPLKQRKGWSLSKERWISCEGLKVLQPESILLCGLRCLINLGNLRAVIAAPD